MPGTPNPISVSTRLQRIAKLAKDMPEVPLRTLAHHIDRELLMEALKRTRKSGAVGVDGQTAKEFSEDLEGNLDSLLDELKSGTYRAPPVRRVHIPKGDGRTRPIGIPTFRDKVLQRAVCMVMEAVYEQDFLPCSYGFRPGRSAHHALEGLRGAIMECGGCWVLEADIRGFFDQLVHQHLKEFLRQRVRDGVLRRMVHKWLKAGILEEGFLSHPTKGTPQGGVISPLLANVYLHEVLDKWFEHEIKPRLAGRARLIRYADDFVIVLSSEKDAQRVWDVLPKRFGRFGLDLHPEKTRVIRFLRPSKKDPPRGGPGQRRGFDFLGFSHFWGKSRKGNMVVKQETANKSLRKALKAVWVWCRGHRHEKVRTQWEALVSKLRGHYQYFGITGNWYAMGRFWHGVRRSWRRWLNSRSQRAGMTWKRYARLLQRYPLPGPVVVHSVLRQQRSRGSRSRMR